ncbi:MAG: tagaturonate reductase [Clostridia bacterium]
MNKLSYETLKDYDGYLLKDAPERILQFGEGNFLRAFVDYFVDEMNEKADFNGKVVLCQPIANGLTDMINDQDGLYTLYLRGFENGETVNKKKIISSVSRCINPYADFAEFLNIAKNPDLRFIASNTTEAGIAYDASCNLEDAPPSSFPAKLTRFMLERFINFNGAEDKGFIILSCELIDYNGDELKKCVLQYVEQWELSEEFKNWLINCNQFCSTLVDRIVTGYPRSEADKINEENGYVDNLIDTGEVFGFWVIEGDQSIKKEFPYEKANLPILVTDDHSPYKQRKVKILNGAHTTMVLGAYLAGQDIVRDCMNDDVIMNFMKKTIYDEIIPTIKLDKQNLMEFTDSVIDRFKNPFIDHELLAISLNSTSKWKARVMPSLLEYIDKFGELPKLITASFAFYIAFFSGKKLDENGFFGTRNGSDYPIKDDKEICEFYFENKDLSAEELVAKVCANKDFWGMDLSELKGFESQVCEYLNKINTVGSYQVMKELI